MSSSAIDLGPIGASGNEPPFNSFERPVIGTLQRYLRNPSTPPLLTNNEEDLAIINDETFFQAVSQRFVPSDVLPRLRSGDLTHEDIEHKMRVGELMTRREKAFMFTERMIVATIATDSCRALSRVARDGEGDFVPVLPDDTVEIVQHRVGDYVSDLLRGGRETRELRNAAMDRLTQTIRAKFDTHPEAARVLTTLAGQNSRKKVGHYADQLATVTVGFERDKTNAETKVLLHEYLRRRPQTYHLGLELITLMAERQARIRPAPETSTN